jgi:hypothetical protein
VGITQPGLHDRTGRAATLALPVVRGLPAGLAARHRDRSHHPQDLRRTASPLESPAPAPGVQLGQGKKITAEALELADAQGVTISMDIGQYRADVRRRAATYAVRATRQLGGDARHRALAAARNLTVFFPEARVHALIRAAAEETRPAGSPG